MSHLRMTTQEYLARNLKKQGRIKNVKKKVVDGITFDSTGEAIRHQDLCLQQKAGQISGLSRQVPFAITINGTHIGFYVADFVYYRAGGERVVEDWKGHRDSLYIWKRKCVEACHGFKILETGRKR